MRFVSSRRSLILGSIAGVLLGALSAGTASAQEKVKVNISGSDTMNLLTQRLAEEYMKKNPNVAISVRGGGSGTGISDLLEGLVDIAQSSRKMKEQERSKARENGYEPVEFIAALDGIAIAVNAKSPIDTLTVGQVKALYTGAVKNWNELDPSFPNAPVVLYSRESNCGTYDFFKERVMEGSTFAPNTSYLAATTAIATAVSKEQNAVGFGGVAYFVRPEGVKVLKIKADKDAPAISPVDTVNHHVNLKVVQDGSYAISRPLQYYTPDEATGEVKNFLDFVLSDAGQAIVLREEYIPLGKPAAAATGEKH